MTEDQARLLVEKWRARAQRTPYLCCRDDRTHSHGFGPAIGDPEFDPAEARGDGACADELEALLTRPVVPAEVMRCSKCGTDCQDELCLDGSADSHTPVAVVPAVTQ